MAASVRAILSRVILVMFGLCLALVILEATLQISAVFVGRQLAQQSSWLGQWRMLCLGDSNTYGLWVEHSQAYPTVFERLWNANPANVTRQVQVFNLGYPGTNSSKVLKDFRRMLWTFRPDVVTVMIGGNDPWTVPETASESPDRIDRLAAELWRVSRVYRLLYMVRRAVQIRRLDVAAEPRPGQPEGHATARYGAQVFDLGSSKMPEGGVPGWHPSVHIQRHLESLAAQAADFGTKLVFLTYAADSTLYGWANGFIRNAAKVTGTPLIDLAAALKEECPVPANSNPNTGPWAQCPELFPDQHPTVLGHERVAQILAQQLTTVLDQSRQESR